MATNGLPIRLPAIDTHDANKDPRVTVGGPDCLKPYSASVLNISAMSFGSLSKNAVQALNAGAAKGGFAHNTGEGGVTPYHNEPGGDLIWQLGTGYFGARAANGDFDADKFAVTAAPDNIKMIELKCRKAQNLVMVVFYPRSKIPKRLPLLEVLAQYNGVVATVTHRVLYAH